ncbi:agamous-like MADS-box protein AGL80 [Phragmites australis]|uniref:agamous-like MADS-box protein AGL80 n=1 Tax=Phragmites australis TaxID=29695 RepID=UPI002D77DBED|nr:agamous-like MADS-box protein AGL80 [Phragmites australis]
MARKKVNLQWIANDSTRRAAFKKRCKGLMKKASELATLCDVKVCVLVYEEGEAQPEVWPSVPEARRLINRFKTMPEVGSLKKMQNQEDFLCNRTSKLYDQVCKSHLENHERETKYLLHESMVGHRQGFHGVSVKELTNLGSMVETKIRNAKARLKQLVGGQGALPVPSPSLAPVSPSSQPLFPYTYTEIHAPALAEELQLRPQLQDWPADQAQNGGELGAVICNAFAGSSSGCTVPSGSGVDMMQPSNLDGSAGFPWLWDSFPTME